jgi:hypothetical protein
MLDRAPLYSVLTLVLGARKDTDTEEFRHFKRTLTHGSITNILLPVKPFMTTPDIVQCPDRYFRRVLYGLGPHISDYPEQAMAAWILLNWCATYVKFLHCLLSRLAKISHRCHAHPRSLDTPCRLRTADHTAVLLSLHTPDVLRENYGIVPNAKVDGFPVHI